MGFRSKLRKRTRDSARRRYYAEYERECHVCGSGEDVELHHRNGDPFDNRILNLIPLCNHHHKRAHLKKKRIRDSERIDEWKNGFLALGR